MFIHTNKPLMTSFYIKRYLFFAELAMSQRWSAIFCATGVWGGKPIGRVRVKLQNHYRFSLLGSKFSWLWQNLQVISINGPNFDVKLCIENEDQLYAKKIGPIKNHFYTVWNYLSFFKYMIIKATGCISYKPRLTHSEL